MVFPSPDEVIERLQAEGNRLAYASSEASLDFRRLAGRTRAIADSLILAGMPKESPVAMALAPGSLAEWTAVHAIVASGNVIVPLFEGDQERIVSPGKLKTARCAAVIYTAVDRGISQSLGDLVARIEIDDEAFVVASFDGDGSVATPHPGVVCIAATDRHRNAIDRQAIENLGGWLAQQLDLKKDDSIFSTLPLHSALGFFPLYASQLVGCCLLGRQRDEPPRQALRQHRARQDAKASTVCLQSEEQERKWLTEVNGETVPDGTKDCLLQRCGDDPAAWLERSQRTNRSCLLLRATEEHGLCFYLDERKPSNHAHQQHHGKSKLGRLLPFVEHRFDETPASNGSDPEGLLLLRRREDNGWSPLSEEPVVRRGQDFYLRPKR